MRVARLLPSPGASVVKCRMSVVECPLNLSNDQLTNWSFDKFNGHSTTDIRHLTTEAPGEGRSRATLITPRCFSACAARPETESRPLGSRWKESVLPSQSSV